jgi:nitrite reductase (NADH) large subunit
MIATNEKYGNKLIVVGNGMTGFKFCQKMVEKGLHEHFSITVFGEEPYEAYDRVHLTSYYTGTPVAALTLASREWYTSHNIQLITSTLVSGIDRERKVVLLPSKEEYAYDTLVLASGSSPFVPAMEGVDLNGVYVYRTFEDLDAIKQAVVSAKKGAVIGGGLLGLEAAKALLDDGIQTTVIERNTWLMNRQLDEAGGLVLQQLLEKQSLAVMTGAITTKFSGSDSVRKIHFSDGSELEVDIVIISAGIKPRDELARASGLEIGKPGGIVVNNNMQTSDASIFAIGECALAQNMIWGLVAPCYQMAEVLAEQLAGNEASFDGADMSTKLKLIGTEVASFGDAMGQTAGSVPLVLNNTFGGVYKRLNVTSDGKYLLGGIMIGDASDYNMLHQAFKSRIKLPANPETMLYSSKGGGGMKISVLDLPDEASICSCENITKGKICSAIKEHDITGIAGIKKHTKAGTGCGGCVPMLDDIHTAFLKSQGKEVKKVLCEHFNHTRQELFDFIKIGKIKTFPELIKAHGHGSGCEICKPAVASLLASIWNESIVKHAVIQDTNDRFLANIQRGGTYSVVPRIPGGEITPEKLQAIGRIADKYSLYTKITGGQRIDMFGARVDQLPDIWEELIAEGFESGHAYGKSLRTVKSCVGSTWCRFGLHDSVSFAIEIENRYKGLRSPHKLKGGVSGCIRECAEARGKDFGIIATDKGWNLFVCGNGGANPAHAVLLASDIDSQTCIQYLDRFLMYYIKTASPLTRTSKWLAGLDGGIEHLKEVVIDDSLGMAAEFERDMQHTVDTYSCEWKEAVTNPDIRSKFRAFVNSAEPDNSIEFVGMRDQKMPLQWKK